MTSEQNNHAAKWTAARNAFKDGKIVIVTFPDGSRSIVRGMVRSKGVSLTETSFGMAAEYSDFSAFETLPEALKYLNGKGTAAFSL